MNQKMLSGLSLSCLCVLGACGDSANEPGAPAAVATSLSAQCLALLGGTIDGVPFTIDSAALNAATDDLPEHCEIVGSIGRRISDQDGQTYEIGFHLRLPTDWNGRFLYQGGGGADGNLGQANAPQIREGFAVVSSDSGHDNATNTSSLAGTYQFGFDQQARVDFGYRGPALAAQAAKSLTQNFYGSPISYSYFAGCSEGGREGLMFSQRFPDMFDGIVAGNPGMDLPKAAIAQAWDSQAFARAARATTPFGHPDLASAFTNEELAAVGAAILAQCDSLDGLEDGMVFAPRACMFDPATLGPDGSRQISANQVAALASVFAGPTNSAGEPLYTGWYWDPGIVAQGWRQWKIGPLFDGFPAPGNSAINVTLGGGAVPFIFTTPPNAPTSGTELATGTVVTTANPLGTPETVNFGDAFVQYMLSYNMDTDAPKASATTEAYPESPMSFMATSSVEYDAFRSSGGKLIVYSGQADPVFSTQYHVAWYEDLVTASGGLDAAQSFARLFLVPGMNHCGGGPSTSQFDTLSPLIEWVENGAAPTSLIATAADTAPWPGRTRPLCAYPQSAAYAGAGSIEDAASFTCSARSDIAAILADPSRPAADRNLDATRSPAQLLDFFGVSRGDRVADLLAGGGYYTRILVPLVGASGRVYAGNNPFYAGFFAEAFDAMLADPAYASVVRVDGRVDELGLPADGSLDAVIISQAYHDLVLGDEDRGEMNRRVFSALKTGGVYGIVDHAAAPGTGTSATESLHRIDEQFIVDEVTAAGFVLAAEADFLANPDDGHSAVIFNPEISGRTDRFVLRFEKP